jgi:hypothetical protein
VSPPLSAHGYNGTVEIWCGATTVDEETSQRLASDQMFADNARHYSLGFVMLRAIFALWISLVVGVALLAEGSSAEAQKQKRTSAKPAFSKGLSHDWRKPRCHRPNRQVRLSR